MPDYKKICSGLLKDLPKRQREVLSRRFGLKSKERETLESVGKSFGVTRERIRQIENDGFLRLKFKIKENQKVLQYFKDFLRKEGGLKRENTLLAELGGERQKNQVYFLLSLSQDFQRMGEAEDFYPLWALDRNSIERAKKTAISLSSKIRKIGRPLTLEELNKINSLNLKALSSYLEASKKIEMNQDGLFGLKEWPEINPRGVKDKAYLIFKKQEKPLHFTKVAGLIDSALPQTVHNELIKDPRFVLVGRGIYALKEWGYQEGAVKDVIKNILEEKGKPLSREEILNKVLEQRLVKENTVLLNLSNRKYFQKDSRGLYQIREI